MVMLDIMVLWHSITPDIETLESRRLKTELFYFHLCMLVVETRYPVRLQNTP